MSDGTDPAADNKSGPRRLWKKEDGPATDQARNAANPDTAAERSSKPAAPPAGPLVMPKRTVGGPPMKPADDNAPKGPPPATAAGIPGGNAPTGSASSPEPATTRPQSAGADSRPIAASPPFSAASPPAPSRPVGSPSSAASSPSPPAASPSPAKAAAASATPAASSSAAASPSAAASSSAAASPARAASAAPAAAPSPAGAPASGPAAEAAPGKDGSKPKSRGRAPSGGGASPPKDPNAVGAAPTDGSGGDNLPRPTIAAKHVIPRTVETEMRQSFLDYSMSVIVSRALPDARDGLKPVHRRILYAMGELGMGPTSAYKKSARVVGEVLGKYHPHGDSSVYEAMVRMAQDWSLRYPLVDGQGNFGSVDGDGAAAMRYTEARLARITQQILSDLDKETVDFGPNFDATLQEPLVMPAAIPNLLVNGSSGIAVGMATNVPPHNLREIVDATVRVIDEPEVAIAELLQIVQGPDFPTGGIIHGKAGVLSALATGRGRVVVRGKYELEENGDRERIVFTEIPYQVNKSELLIHIAELVKEKVIEGISDLRDESDRQGMRMVIELKRDTISDVVLNQLWKHTPLQSTFAVNNLALVGGRPRTMGLKELLEVFLKHRFVVVTRRTQYELKKAEARAHLLEGLLIALANIDAVVALIRASKDPETALAGLIAKFGLTEIQGKAILDMKLQRLTSLETDAVKTEHAELLGQITRFKQILADPKEVYKIIRDELIAIKAEFGDDRRTQIADADIDIDDESLIPEEESVFLRTRDGYLKRMPLDTWRSQNRGGKGLRGMRTKEEDEVVDTTVGSTHDWLCVFTNKGRIHWLKGYKVPSGSRNHKGKPVVNLLQLEAGEEVETVIPVRDFEENADQGEKAPTLFFATKNGTVKRTALSDFKNVRANGIIAITLDEGDELLAVRRTDGNADIILATKMGQACRFDESEVRVMGRPAGGVRGITLEKGDEVVSLAVAEQGTDLLSVTVNGYGKRTNLDEYRKTHRGGKGVRTIVVSQRNGPVIAVRPVKTGESLLLITKMGMGVRIPVEQLRTMGRATQGVTLMDVAEGDMVTQVAVLPEESDPPSAPAGGEPGSGGGANGVAGGSSPGGEPSEDRPSDDDGPSGDTDSDAEA